MAPRSPSPTAAAHAPARASSTRDRKSPKRFADEPLAVITKRPRGGYGASASGKKKKATKRKAANTAKKTRATTTRRKKDALADECADEPDLDALADDEADELAALEEDAGAGREATRRVAKRPAAKAKKWEEGDPEFVGAQVPADVARAKWPKRYQRDGKSTIGEEEEEVMARCHYEAAKVEEIIYNLGDDVYVRAGGEKADYIGRINEIFEGTDNGRYFNCQWFFRPEDTVILTAKLVDDHTHDPKRVFLSDEGNDNPLDCIVSKVKILQTDPKLHQAATAQLVEDYDLYYDMTYTMAYSTFANAVNGNCYINESLGISSNVDSEANTLLTTAALLDLYSGCGGMSTGLCLGAGLAGLKLETRWAVDFNSHACKSFKSNHPQTEVRNMKAEDFLCLLKEWALLCDKYVHSNNAGAAPPTEDEEEGELEKDEFVVDKLTEICYGGADRKSCIYFKVQWKGFGPEEDTWEPIENLCDCPLKIMEFVQEGYIRKILPLPGDVDVLCGGPPCQGISGFNRYRNRDEPLKDDKNRQIVIFMNIVSYLRPKYVLMENVVDILKFADGYLGRYALSHLVAMKYQSRMGIMVAGCYGLPQFRMRVFLWGALPTMALPKYALPTHHAVVRGGAPNAFFENIVAYNETQKPNLERALVLDDAISDLPEVGNDQPSDVMEYLVEPKTEFQCYHRLSRKEMLDCSFGDIAGPVEGKLLDHRPLKLNKDDFERVRRIPYKKVGANFRALEGVRVGPNNVVQFHPNIPRVYLESGKPLVPQYAMNFVGGKSLKPFGRLWGDETVQTVVTRAEPHNQAILHPSQARVLIVRENARLQGFPDYYQMDGPIKQRYMQVGNAVAVPVARALGYSLGLAYLHKHDGSSDPLFVLPANFFNPGQTEAIARASSVGLPAGKVDEE
ncbi:DNA (cytosine-5)-methyltransferase 1-like [Lolium rigidum]|uniref:DNA (cytosine-5)-methyltransferase 1-like n=1 Tax=Lolium rigidum TaxID=89674 RepID=UPI001F5C1040|nr:DNA (cytosine-5)-methyltransferase 1-like [Lolium rigidum]